MRLRSLVLTLPLLFFAAPASAGNLTVLDPAKVFSYEEILRIQEEVEQLPFDVLLLVKADLVDVPFFFFDLDHLMPGEDKLMAFRVDPDRNVVFTRYGYGVLDKRAYARIDNAGNWYFEQGFLYNGVFAMVREARILAPPLPEEEEDDRPSCALCCPTSPLAPPHPAEDAVMIMTRLVLTLVGLAATFIAGLSMGRASKPQV